MNNQNYETNDAANPLSLKYQTIEDYMNNSPLSNIDASLSYNLEDTQLQFNKPIFDMAFIITTKVLIEKLGELQKKFQTKFGFTTHCIYLPDENKLKFCIRDLKLHQILYAVVLTDKFLSDDIMDLFILYPIIEIQRKMGIEDILDLVKEDFETIIEAIKQLKDRKGHPHPLKVGNQELFNMTDEIRYQLCLLSDHRMLDKEELFNLKKYLEHRVLALEKAISLDPKFFIDRPLEACRQERLKYYIYEPLSGEIAGPSNASNYIPDVQRNLIKFSVSASVAPTSAQPSNQYHGHHVYEAPVINRAKTITNDFSGFLKQIKGAQICRGIVKPLCYEIIQGRLIIRKQPAKKQQAEFIKYLSSDYGININLWAENQDVISLSSGSSPPPMDYELIAVTPPSPHISPPRVTLGKRTSDSLGPANNQVTPKFYKPATELKNTPDILINLFRFILNVAPYELPDNNSLLAMLNADCNVLQNGIIEPNLKNVSIDYYSCKTNGTVEIIQSIYSIYEVNEKNVEDLHDLQYIWTKYFPDNVSNLSLLVVFYKFIKLLIIFGLLNLQSDRLKIVMDCVEKINAIINFTFDIPILSENDHLNFKSDIFNKNYKNHDKLHAKYFDLPHLSNIPTSEKKLDLIIKKKKIEFILSPLLTYFVNTMKSIHRKMQVQQARIVYNAIRTMRYCLREIHPINIPLTVFNESKTFSESHECLKEIKDEAKWLLDELKYYQCVLFTEKHYDFINSLLNFCLKIEESFTNGSETNRAQSSDSLFTVDPVQFIESFASNESMTLQYHPESEISFWKEYLKSSWVKILQKAFQETPLKYEGRPIIKEINNLLPSLWSSRTFDEAVTEATKLNYAEWVKKAQVNQSGCMESFSKAKVTGISWLNNNQLSLKKAVEEFRKYEVMLQNEFSCQ